MSADAVDDGCHRVRIFLVACGKRKERAPCAARALYTGPLFRAALAHAIASAAEVRIVSARYGLVALDDVLAPYDQHLAGVARDARYAWGQCVADDLAHVFAAHAIHATLLMGACYAHVLTPALDRRGIPWWRPVTGLTLGQQLRWYARRTSP